MPRRPALPKDPSQRAKKLLDMVTGESDGPSEPKLSAAQEFAKIAGTKGGAARASTLSSERRSEIASLAAKGRWDKKNGGRGKG